MTLNRIKFTWRFETVKPSLLMLLNKLEAKQLTTAVRNRWSFTKNQHRIAFSFGKVLFFHLFLGLSRIKIDSCLKYNEFASIFTQSFKLSQMAFNCHSPLVLNKLDQAVFLEFRDWYFILCFSFGSKRHITAIRFWCDEVWVSLYDFFFSAEESHDCFACSFTELASDCTDVESLPIELLVFCFCFIEHFVYKCIRIRSLNYFQKFFSPMRKFIEHLGMSLRFSILWQTYWVTTNFLNSATLEHVYSILEIRLWFLVQNDILIYFIVLN